MGWNAFRGLPGKRNESSRDVGTWGTIRRFQQHYRGMTSLRWKRPGPTFSFETLQEALLTCRNPCLMPDLFYKLQRTLRALGHPPNLNSLDVETWVQKLFSNSLSLLSMLVHRTVSIRLLSRKLVWELETRSSALWDTVTFSGIKSFYQFINVA